MWIQILPSACFRSRSREKAGVFVPAWGAVCLFALAAGLVFLDCALLNTGGSGNKKASCNLAISMNVAALSLLLTFGLWP